MEHLRMEKVNNLRAHGSCKSRPPEVPLILAHWDTSYPICNVQRMVSYVYSPSLDCHENG